MTRLIKPVKPWPLAAKAFRHTAAYDALIAEYFTAQVGEEKPEKLTLTYDLKQAMRYGENPQQKAYRLRFTGARAAKHRLFIRPIR